jgi:hypothetical protein
VGGWKPVLGDLSLVLLPVPVLSPNLPAASSGASAVIWVEVSVPLSNGSWVFHWPLHSVEDQGDLATRAQEPPPAQAWLFAAPWKQREE